MRLLWMLVLLSLAGCGKTNDRVIEADCQRVREHAADLRVASIQLSGDERTRDKELAKHRGNFAQSGGDEYLAQCAAERSPDWVECSLAASTLRNMNACGR